MFLRFLTWRLPSAILNSTVSTLTNCLPPGRFYGVISVMALCGAFYVQYTKHWI